MFNRRSMVIAVACLLLVTVLGVWETRRTAQPPAAPTNIPPAAPTPAPEKPVAHPAVQPPTPIGKPAPVAVVHAPIPHKPVKTIPKVTPLPPKPVTPPPVVTRPPPPPAPPVNPTEWKGTDTSITHEGQIVIKNDHQWIQFWSEHRPHEVSPDVDFTQNMVIGVFAGPRPADAFAIQIINAVNDGHQLLVAYQEQNPPPGTFSVGVEVHPYDIKVIPKSPLPVKFKPYAPKQ